MNTKLLGVSLASMFGDYENVFENISTEKVKKLILIPIIGFALLFAQMFSESYFPWWKGFIIGLLCGFIFGWFGIWLYVKIFYGLCWVMRHDLKHKIFRNITYSSFGALLFFALTGLIFQIGSIYFKISWFSGSAFLILGILWSGFSFAKILNAQRKAYFSSIILSFLFLVTLLLIIAYFVPFINKQIGSVIQNIGFLKNSIMINQ